MDETNQQEVVEFRVTNMVTGDATNYRVRSITELRVRLAIGAGVLSPCILLLKQSDDNTQHTILLEDTQDLDTLARGATGTVELYFVNNEEGMRKDVLQWSFDQWIRALKAHIQFEDESIIAHGRSLALVDEQLEAKMHEWLRNVILRGESFEALDEAEEVIKVLIGLGVDMNVTGPSQLTMLNRAINPLTTLLHRAAHLGHMGVLQALLDARVNVDARDGSYSKIPASMAAGNGHTEALQALLRAGANPSLGDRYGFTPLHSAALGGHLNSVSILISMPNVDVDVTRPGGSTPLHCASMRGHTEIARLLIRTGANVNARKDNGENPLHGAVSFGSVNAVRLLINEGADVNVLNDEGWTPLHWAAQRGKLEEIHLLMQAGSNLNAKDSEGRTPYDIARDIECRKALQGEKN